MENNSTCEKEKKRKKDKTLLPQTKTINSIVRNRIKLEKNTPMETTPFVVATV